MNRQKGQIVIILLLITLVALSVGLAITQRTLTNLTTSTQNEQASRAFSAADAGIERAIQASENDQNFSSLSTFDVGPDSKASVTRVILPNPNQALEYPPLGKETIAQFWLADPDNLSSAAYVNNDVDIYFGKFDLLQTSNDSPAIEINAVIAEGLGTPTVNYFSKRFYIDSNTTSANRSPKNGFTPVNQNCSGNYLINTSSSPDATTADRRFRCRHTLTIINPASEPNKKPVMLRARLLYSNLNHQIAVAPSPLSSNSLPRQASLFRSTGISGQSQKTLQVFRLKYVVPNFFEFSIFSSGDIQKNTN